MELAPIPMDLSDLGGADAPSAGSDAATVQLTGPQKAALIVRLIASGGGALSLHRLPEHIQADLIREVGALGPIDQATTEAVVNEFAGLLETADLFGPGGMSRALDLLGGAVSPSVAERVRAQVGFAESEDPWARIVEQDSDSLLPVVEAESIEVAAVILAKLPVSTSADILGRIPGAQARRIAYAISRTAAVDPETVRRIGVVLARLLDIEPERAFSEGPVERVGAILNSARSATRNDVLEGLDESEAEFAEHVRQAIFTFGNIPERVDPSDVPKILRGIDQAEVVRALAASGAEVKAAQEFILDNISQRMADALREEVQDLGTVDEMTADAAMGAIVAEVRRLEEEGEIYLVSKDTEQG
ncbi:flagellar motor switch protein FliG [Ovoidimarina sediminis]|uniref:flagellar motor switch protein FliG n=1 Tax=Ovoidimarina sediminis TaxID=3079856 RepID=UPI00290C8629|nr:FliG C-terminal domain-containing protein [Rhodophyticola sp. MJ-SS7]MDU8944981.1 FliG C-terminal domain-containing protein [Rhodophyticola sp. MJ-SS7]